MLSFPFSSSGEEDLLIKMDGISPDIKSKRLLDNWGFPAKRERKYKLEETWFYPNKNTQNPIDGIVVRIYKGRVKSWRLVENLYSEMQVWGKGAGSGL
jgi:hypothetical protein